MKLNLSRAAKMFREAESKKSPTTSPQPTAPAARKPPKAKTPTPPPVPEPVLPEPEPVPPHPEPVVEPVQAVAPAPEPSAAPKKVWPAKAKRPRFVREQAEKRERAALPPLPPPSTRLTAKLMSKNLALPPKDEPPAPGRRPN